MCTSPNIAIVYGCDKTTGKLKIKLKRHLLFSLQDYWKRYGQENVLMLPCGHCAECILKRRREWSVRCACEALDHNVSTFVTLTYDDVHLRALNKDDPREFIKAIRNAGFKVRYFGCGELGEHTFRPHYHIVLFGFMPKDLVYSGESKSGEAMYTSKFLDSLWKKGIVQVQFFGPRAAAYVAGYTSKKLGSTDGFQFQSTKPGIGFNYINKHLTTILNYGQIFGNFGSVNKYAIPRYFKKILEKDGYSLILDMMTEEKLKNLNDDLFKKARLHGIRQVDEVVPLNKHRAEKKLMKLERNL